MKGLTNLGSTCYLNTALQCLLYCPPLTNYALSGLAVNDLNKKRLNAGALASEYLALANRYWTASEPGAEGHPLDTTALHAALSKLHRPFGATDTPHDCHEALCLLLRHLHDALSKAPRAKPAPSDGLVAADAWEEHLARTGYSLLTDMFQGQLECSVATQEPHPQHRHGGGVGAGASVSVTHEQFMGLSLDARDASSVDRALKAYLEPTAVTVTTGSDARACPGVLTKKLLFCPLVLVLHLNRLDDAGRKMDKYVDYTTELDLRHLGPGGGMYRLFAVAFHAGDHYTAACEVRDRWYLLDDATASEIPVNDVIRNQACLLLYKKTNGW